MPGQLMGTAVSACDFRAQPLKDKASEIKNMTKEEVIDSLKHRIQQKDSVFRKQFLSVSKEPDVKINQGEFRKVGSRPLWGFLPAQLRAPPRWHTYITHCCCAFIS